MSQSANFDPDPREASVSVGVVQALCGHLAPIGIAPAELLRTANVDLAALESRDTRLSRELVYRLCEAAMQLTADPALGLHWSERLSGHTFAPISNLMAHAPTLRGAFETLARFSRLLTDDIGYEQLEGRDTVCLRCVNMGGESLAVQRFVTEMTLSSLFKVLRSFGVPPDSLQVNFAYAPPPHRAEYTRAFEGSVRFEQPWSSLVFDRVYMNAPSPHRDEDVHEALRSVAERRILRLTHRTPYAERMRDVIAQRAASGQTTSMEVAAAALGLSVRSLRRRLAAEGKTYKAVVSEAFASTAQHMLRSSGRTIQEIAFGLGFADPSAFHRAFKRRTGKTPQQYRAEQLQG